MFMSLVGRTPRSAADALVGLVGISTDFEQRDQGVPRGPGGPPHNGSPQVSDLGDGISPLMPTYPTKKGMTAAASAGDELML